MAPIPRAGDMPPMRRSRSRVRSSECVSCRIDEPGARRRCVHRAAWSPMHRPGLEPRPVGSSGPRPNPREPRTRNARGHPAMACGTDCALPTGSTEEFSDLHEPVPTRHNYKKNVQFYKFAVRHSAGYYNTSTVTFSRMVDRVVQALDYRLQPRNHGLRRPHRWHCRDVAGAPTDSSKCNSNTRTPQGFPPELLCSTAVRKPHPERSFAD